LFSFGLKLMFRISNLRSSRDMDTLAGQIEKQIFSALHVRAQLT
jgi:hypothetical protein